ncbi:hypothetical protein M422DRAFT_260372 [Sphaerobolus stellatus SS14]|uniref:Uncharacterized protein n=1 Tax=Sphaerobolus stellatus (strain SS14) TaxID=990650 RepID=A0A0C9UR19_SPHS4|nr:hypothetical protein M422DRAFT_260372 [Sphaerobolus stellatus SS14]
MPGHPYLQFLVIDIDFMVGWIHPHIYTASLLRGDSSALAKTVSGHRGSERARKVQKESVLARYSYSGLRVMGEVRRGRFRGRSSTPLEVRTTILSAPFPTVQALIQNDISLRRHLWVHVSKDIHKPDGPNAHKRYNASLSTESSFFNHHHSMESVALLSYLSAQVRALYITERSSLSDRCR